MSLSTAAPPNTAHFLIFPYHCVAILFIQMLVVITSASNTCFGLGDTGQTGDQVEYIITTTKHRLLSVTSVWYNVRVQLQSPGM